MILKKSSTLVGGFFYWTPFKLEKYLAFEPHSKKFC